jgi:DtxR family manganese transport transcriptional regulator
MRYKIKPRLNRQRMVDYSRFMPLTNKSAAVPRPPAPQAETFRRSRRDRAGEIAQDYVEAIADLSASVGEARVVDLARRLGVTHVTVNRTLARLQRAGYVNTKPYRAIFLTDAGRRLAEESKRRHGTVMAFLCSLGISKKTAEMDAEGIEHHVSPETLAAFRRSLKER